MRVFELTTTGTTATRERPAEPFPWAKRPGHAAKLGGVSRSGCRVCRVSAMVVVGLASPPGEALRLPSNQTTTGQVTP